MLQIQSQGDLASSHAAVLGRCWEAHSEAQSFPLVWSTAYSFLLSWLLRYSFIPEHSFQSICLSADTQPMFPATLPTSKATFFLCLFSSVDFNFVSFSLEIL